MMMQNLMDFIVTAPPPPVVLDAQAVSGILGAISIACWIIVFAPQIYENFKRKSSDGLSLLFVILWLVGDVFNVVGLILQNVLPTMLILAIYYTLADVVLLLQCLMYNKQQEEEEEEELYSEIEEESRLLSQHDAMLQQQLHHHHHHHHKNKKSLTVDPIHLSPANPLNEDVLNEMIIHRETDTLLGTKKSSENSGSSSFYNLILVLLVLVSGIGGWYISYVRHPPHRGSKPHDPMDDDLKIDLMGQFFGYLCAAFYLGSRIPQILLNYKRKSVDGISFMFFFFACMGNLTYVLSILSYGISLRYLIINFSWLLGSVGTLLMDGVIFVQFFVYNEKKIVQNNQNLDDREEYPNYV